MLFKILKKGIEEAKKKERNPSREKRTKEEEKIKSILILNSIEFMNFHHDNLERMKNSIVKYAEFQGERGFQIRLSSLIMFVSK